MPLVRKPRLAPAELASDAATVIAGLRSADAEERWAAARASTAVPRTETVLAQALQVESDTRVREVMLTSLAQIGTLTSIEPLLSMLRSERAALRTAALDALRLTPILPQVIPQLLQDPDADVRLFSCDLVRSLPAALANELLGELLQQEPHPNVCAAVVEVLADVGEPQVLEALALCAKRFPANEFLLFAIKTVIERVHATSASARV